MAPANTNSDRYDIINDNGDDTPAPSGYPIEQQNLVETAHYYNALKSSY